MNVCAVVTRNYMDVVLSAVEKTGNIMLDTFTEGVDHRESTSALVMQANGRPDIMIIDLCVSFQNTWNSIYKIRMVSPDTRIIILCESEDNPLLSQCVRTGIYDIITLSGSRSSSSLIEAALQKPANFAFASRFLTTPEEEKGRGPRTARTTQKRTLDEHIVEEKTIGTVTIAVSSVLPRTGCTTVAVAIARYLADKGLGVALWFNNIEHFIALQDSYTDIDITEPGSRFTLDKIDFCSNIDVADIGDYPFKILDLGHHALENSKEFKRSTMRIVLTGIKDWELPAFERFLANGISQNEPLKTYIYGFVHTDEHTVEELTKSMDGMACIPIPFINDPLKGSAELNRVIGPYLMKYLPGLKAKPAKRRFFSIGKGKKV